MRNVPWWGLVSSAAAPALQVGGWTGAARLQPRPVDPVTDTVSALAAVGAADRWVTTLTLGVTADYESVPDLDVFASGIGRGLAQLGQAD